MAQGARLKMEGIAFVPRQGLYRKSQPHWRLWPLVSLLFLLLSLSAGATLAAEPQWPALTGRIVDNAGLIGTEARARIEQKLQAHEAKTGDQLVIATVPSLQGLSIEDFANRLFRHWQLGTKTKNNGALLLVAPNERKVRIEVGYGLEGALTDALSKVIITTAIAPKFKNGDFPGGIEAGADAILSILTGDAEEWHRRAEVRSDESSGWDGLFGLIVLIFIFLVLRRLLDGSRDVRRHRLRDGRWIVLPTGTGWGGGIGNNWGSGGGWSSGSGGGFSGGGGSSGGGGASGDW